MSKRTQILGLLLLVTLCLSFRVSSDPVVPPLPLFSPDQVLVSFSPGTPSADIRAVHQQAGGQVIKTITAIGVDVVKVPAGTVQDKIKLYERNPNVRYAEPNYLRPLIMPIEGQFSPSIKVFDEQWSLHNNGNGLQTYVDPATGIQAWNYTFLDSDIDAPEAWDISKGSSAIWVAVVDSGVDCQHPDLVGKCIHNEDHVSVEFDSFGTPIPELVDQAGHGTHVAGIIAMNTNNGQGGAGVGWNTSIGSFKVCYLEQFVGIALGSSCLDADIVAGLTAAADYGYDVINMSFGGAHSAAVQAAIDYAATSGAMLIAAAGNSNNWQKLYPAAYSNVLSVGATNAFDDRASFSSFSLDADDWVDVMAPGEPILSTVPRVFCSGIDPQCFQWLRGTSMAAPHVAGIAALVKSFIPSADSNEVRRRIEDCADQVGAMGQNLLVWSKYGRVNAHRALVDPSCDSSPPPTDSVHVGSLSGAVTNKGKNWSASLTVLVHDNDDSTVSGATVSGTWSGGTSGLGGCTTADNGICIIESPDMSKKVSSATFTVNNVSHSSVSYGSGANHDPNPAVLTIAK